MLTPKVKRKTSPGMAKIIKLTCMIDSVWDYGEPDRFSSSEKLDGICSIPLYMLSYSLPLTKTANFIGKISSQLVLIS